MAYYPQPGAGPYGAPGPYGTQGPYGAPVPCGAYGAPAPYGAAYAPPYGAPATLPAPYGAQMQYQPQVQFGTVPGYSQQLPPPYSASFSPKSYFFIRSRLNGLVLDVQGANPAPGTPVIIWNQKNGDNNNNQLWFEDSSTGTIRSKLNEYCLDVAGGRVVLMPYQHGNQNQLWEPFSNLIRNRHQLSKVLAVDGPRAGSGAGIVVRNHSPKQNQTTELFDFQFTSPQDVVSTSVSTACHTTPRRRFRIESEMNCKVLDIRGGNPCSGTDVIMYPKKGGSHLNQLWYFDSQGVIRSALNDMALDSGVGGQKVQMMPYTGEARQQWRLVGNQIKNQAHECLDIRGESKKDGAEVISYKYKGSANQHWRIEYE